MNSHDMHTDPDDLRWPLASAVARPERKAVQLWCSVLRCDPTALTGLAQVLSAEETQRAARFGTEALRHRFIISHGVLRHVLGAGLHLSPHRLRFAKGTNGKPHLADEGEVQFNLAHTADLMVLAVTRGMAVGVDVERVRRLRDARGIARRFFTTRESDWLMDKKGLDLDRAFFHLWTRKEAILKATGDGLSSGLETIELLDAEGRFLASVAHGAQGLWQMHSVEPAAGFVAAVALPAAAGSVPLKTAAYRAG